MEYTEQRQFLRSSRAWGAGLVLLLFAAMGWCIKSGVASPTRLLALDAALVSALAVFIYYTPDYLHLTVDPGKRPRWAVRIRWRIIPIICGLLVSNARDVAWMLAACAWLLVINLFGRKAPRRFLPLYYWMGDIALLSALLFIFRLNILLATLLIAAAAHLAIVLADKIELYWVSLVSTVSVLFGPSLGPAAGNRSALRSRIDRFAARNLPGNGLSRSSRRPA